MEPVLLGPIKLWSQHHETRHGCSEQNKNVQVCLSSPNISTFNVPKMINMPLLVLQIHKFCGERDKQEDSFKIMCMMRGVFMDYHGSTEEGCLAQFRGQRRLPGRCEALAKINQMCKKLRKVKISPFQRKALFIVVFVCIVQICIYAKGPCNIYNFVFYFSLT